MSFKSQENDIAMKDQTDSYIVAGSKPWNQKIFQDIISHYPGQWTFVKDKDDFTADLVREINPRYIFFLHWSWKVPEEIFNSHECICFHMTDVPYGRGGSPLQNLIIRGHRKTKLTALKMAEELDSGPVYLKDDLSLEGNAEEIYLRATTLSAEMIKKIIQENPVPVPQEGKIVKFNRRKPQESEILSLDSLIQLHDFIRMVDAEGYPKAYLIYRGYRFEFNRAALYNEKIVADVTITKVKEIHHESSGDCSPSG